MDQKTKSGRAEVSLTQVSSTVVFSERRGPVVMGPCAGAVDSGEGGGEERQCHGYSLRFFCLVVWVV